MEKFQNTMKVLLRVPKAELDAKMFEVDTKANAKQKTTRKAHRRSSHQQK